MQSIVEPDRTVVEPMDDLQRDALGLEAAKGDPSALSAEVDRSERT